MASRSTRSFFSFIFAFVFPLGGFFVYESIVFGQESASGPYSSPDNRARNRSYLDWLESNWNQRGRTVPPGELAAALRFRAYRQKLAMRAWRAAASDHSPQPPNRRSGATHAFTSSPAATTVWAPLGPAPLASDPTGDGGQDYNWVSGRATTVVIDPADTSGNTVLVGGAYGGLWKSTNAGSLSGNPDAVVWQALIDDQPTLAVGAIALQPVASGNPSHVILVGTGETNSSSDSYYGLGILRSADGGSTWTQITGIGLPADESFLGIGFSKIAFSTANPSLVVAATAGDNGFYAGLEEDANSTARGLYGSQDGGMSWNRVTLTDGAVPASATAVVYNPVQGAFYAFIRRHGLYSSTDGQNFNRVNTQPTAGLASTNCPAASNSTTCPIYRGEFAVVPGRNEMYVWVVDVQTDGNNNPMPTPVPTDEGIWRSSNGGGSWAQIPDNGITNCGDSAFGPNSGCGVEQGWYNLALSAIPDGTATDLYAGAVNLYKCTIAGGTTCTQGDWINLTHVYGCDPGPLGAPAHVHPDQHGIAFIVVGVTSPGYFAHDGGISRTLDGYAGLNTGSCTGTNQFDSLSETLGSMTQFVSFSVHPTDADILLGGTQGNGSPKTSTATGNSTWQNALGGDGGFNAINPSNPNEWFVANPYVSILSCEEGTDCHQCQLGANCSDGTTFAQVVGSNDLGGDQGPFYTPYILDPQNTSEMLVGTCRVWRIGTSGNSPQQLSNDFETFGTGVCTGNEINLVNGLATGGPPDSNSDSTVVYAVTNGYGPLSGFPGGEVWVTTSAGVNLMTNVTQNINPNGYAISSVAMDSSDSTGNTAYVGIMGFSTASFPTSHVWQTTNAGVSWTDWTGTGLPDAPVNALLVDATVTPSQIYVGTDMGAFVSSTTAPSWMEVGPAPGPNVSGFLPNAPVTALQLFYPDAGTKSLVASTYGRGIWYYAIIAAPGFTNVISTPPQTIFPTQTATFNGAVTAQNGYASSVNLSCTGAAPATCTLNPLQVNLLENPTATYSVTAGGIAGDYTFNAHAVGTDQNAITRDAPLTLHVVDFNLTAPSPNSLFVQQSGISSPATFQVTASGSFAGAVTLSCQSGLPAGAACLFSPSTLVSPTSSAPVAVSMTVTAEAGTPLGGPTSVTLAAMAAGAPAAKAQTFALTVTGAANFTWTDVGPASAMVLAGLSASYTLLATPGGGAPFAAAVTFACSSLPALTNCAFNPASIAAGAGPTPVSLTITTTGPNSAAQSRPQRGVRRAASAASASAATTSGGGRPCTIAPRPRVLPLFTLAWVVLVVGIALGGRKNRSQPRLYGVPAGVFLALGLMAEISCGGVAGGGGGGMQDFAIAITASPGSTPVNQSVTWSGTLTAENGYSAAVAMGCSPTAPGTCTLTPQTVIPEGGGGAPFTVTLASETAGTFNFTIQGTDGTTTHATPTETLMVGTASGVTVTPASASLYANEAGNAWPAGVNQQQFTADQNVTWAVTGGNTNGAISAAGLYTPPAVVPTPATVTVTAMPASGPSGSALVTVIPATPLGTTQITVTATALGGIPQSDVVTLTVQ